MKESLKFTFGESMGTWTARSCGYKATSTNSLHFAAQRLIEKIYGYTPVDLTIGEFETFKVPNNWRIAWWTASGKRLYQWTAPQKEGE